MSLTRPRTMRGVMELLPLDQIAFQGMLDTIREGYERFGFLPVETPVMEYRDVLLTKEGGETERQVYFAQSTGSIEQGKEPELALRFDLTVPLARYVAEHERKLTFPFRRYQIQRVYRGEQAQRGRYREFYQCDIDVIGKDKLPIAYDAEIPAAIHYIFNKLNVGNFTIHMNNRKIMTGFFASQGVSKEHQPLVLREVDKLDKRGADYVKETLTGENFGLSAEVVDAILNFIAMEGETAMDTIAALREMTIEDETFNAGVEELAEVITNLSHSGVPEAHYRVNLSIARGLDYYTGTVYETTLDDHPEVGSVCSGGRYENLASHYTKSHLPGVGISIGATRLFYQLQAAGLIETGKSTVLAYVTRMDESLGAEYLKLASELRAGGISAEVNYSGGKFGKQMKAADRAGVRFAIIMGENELAEGNVTVKDLVASEQFVVAREGLVAAIKERLS